MLNNKGQVLVLFVLLIPIMLLILVLVIDIGNLSYEKQALHNICKLGSEFYKEDKNIEKLDNYIKLNDKDITNIYVNNNELKLEKEVKGILSHVVNIKMFDINVKCDIKS